MRRDIIVLSKDPFPRALLPTRPPTFPAVPLKQLPFRTRIGILLGIIAVRVPLRVVGIGIGVVDVLRFSSAHTDQERGAGGSVDLATVGAKARLIHSTLVADDGFGRSDRDARAGDSSSLAITLVLQ